MKIGSTPEGKLDNRNRAITMAPARALALMEVPPRPKMSAAAWQLQEQSQAEEIKAYLSLLA